MTKSQTSFTTIDTESERIETFEANSNLPICNKEDKRPIQELFRLMALSAKQTGLDKNQKLLNYVALRENNVTIGEAHKAFWKAMADPYVPTGSGIEIRHLMKYISENRKKEDKTYYTYEQVLNKMEKEHIPQTAFEITDKERNGQRLWVLK